MLAPLLPNRRSSGEQESGLVLTDHSLVVHDPIRLPAIPEQVHYSLPEVMRWLSGDPDRPKKED